MKGRQVPDSQNRTRTRSKLGTRRSKLGKKIKPIPLTSKSSVLRMNAINSILEPELEMKPESELAHECTACRSMIVDELLYPLPCGHYYCFKCISDMAISSIDYENFYPPRCCGQPIPDEILGSQLSGHDLQKFKTRREELAVPFAHRVYCPKQTCSAFLGSSQLDNSESSQLTCGGCNTNVCLDCREVAHPGTTCNRDIVVQTAAQERGWKTCPNPQCKRIIERIEGCRWIICHCRAVFCYLCTGDLDSCKCSV